MKMTTIASLCHGDVQQKLFEGPAAIKKEFIRTFFSIAVMLKEMGNDLKWVDTLMAIIAVFLIKQLLSLLLSSLEFELM